MKTVKGALLDALGGAAFVLLAPILYLVEPFWRFRFAELHDDRLGHLALDTEIFTRRMEMRGWPKRTTWVFVSWNPANRTVMTLLKRRHVIVENKAARRLFIAARPFLSRTRFMFDTPHDGTEHAECNYPHPQLSFTAEEDRQGWDYLRGLGMGDGDWFVCIHGRSQEYLKTRQGFAKKPRKDSYRDCDIRNYLAAARWVVDQGGWVFRMGAPTEQPLPDDVGPRIVDYAVRHRTDFLDVWLAARCRYFIGNSSGLNSVCHVFNVPMGLANYVTINFASLGRNTRYIPKLFLDEDGQPTPFETLAREGMMEWHGTPDNLGKVVTRWYAHQPERWQENSPEDILLLCQDVHDLIQGKESASDVVALQRAYRDLYGASPHNVEDGGLVSGRFILKYRHLLPSALAPVAGSL